jgi:acetylornithine deacetylase/succinyl-diaminopimelate desuccinylase-like protein
VLTSRRASRALLALVLPYTVVLGLGAQATPAIDWSRVEAETLEHFQALVRFDTSDPPGNEQPAAEYIQRILEREGIPFQVFSLEAHRPNVVARLKGTGARRPLLLMGHTDVVNVDPAKWKHPPFSAVRDGDHVYGRGTIDDKDNLTASLMTMLLLKRHNVTLDRDVIFLAEAGEEGSTQVGIQFMADRHFDAIDAEYCLAEGGGATRDGGQVRTAQIQTAEKIPRAIQLTATGVAGHGSVPLESNPIVRLSVAVARVAAWEPPIRLNETTATYFRRLAQISTGEQAARYAAVLDPAKAREIDRYFRVNEPRHAALLHTTTSPTMVDGGYRVNVIPSEAKATIDVRTLAEEDPDEILELVRKVVNDPAVRVEWGRRNVRPPGSSDMGTEAFRVLEANLKKHYNAPVLPTMSTGATDMAYLRTRGVQCYGIGPATDNEDGPLGYGAHSDQERILVTELHRFVRFNWDVVTELARAR